jgi:formylglycine-generating enzyme required for sulfatase activity
MQTFKPSLFRVPALCLLAWVAGCIPKPPVPDAPPAVAAPAQLADDSDPSICTAGYVRIEPGTFVMGSPTGEEGRGNDESQHSVTITRAYCMKATEVTQGEWQAVMRSNPSQDAAGCGMNCPVEQVSWDYAVDYANAMSRSEGLPECYDGTTFIGLDCKGYRLPTEAEWEYAARAGTTAATYGNLDSVAWTTAATHGIFDQRPWSERMMGTIHPVRQKQPNAWGLYDMLGNVWEWTGDWYAFSYPGAAFDPLVEFHWTGVRRAPPYPGAVTDPVGDGVNSTNFMVLRGGSAAYGGAGAARAANRHWLPPSTTSYDIGFRLVRTLS